MKKIINGKQYNTDTAKDIGSWDNHQYGDFGFVEETLYQKRTGEFFLYGAGGPASKYAESAGGNNWAGGSQIIPLTWDEAREWAEKHLDVDNYEAVFGEVLEDDGRVALSLSLSAATVEIARREASKQGISLSLYIERKLREKD